MGIWEICMVFRKVKQRRAQASFFASLILRLMERATGIEPAYSAWKADVLPLNYARIISEI